MNDRTDEIQSCVGLLREISEMCEHATLTGSLSTGAGRTTSRYNATLLRLIQLGAVPEGLFQPLPDSSDFGEIGVESRMLASYATRGKEAEKHHRKGRAEPGILIRLAPFVDAADLGLMIREHLKSGQPLDLEDLTHLAPFMDRGTLGTLLRENLSKARNPELESGPGPTSEPGSQPEADPGPTPIPMPNEGENPPSLAGRPSLADLVARLSDPDITPEERERILEQMRQMTA